jgi:hypothetical protein
MQEEWREIVGSFLANAENLVLEGCGDWVCSLNGEVRNAYIDTVLVGKTLRK